MRLDGGVGFAQGGFNEGITAGGEDINAEFRIRKAGWLTFRGTLARFYERRRKTWKGLWKEYFWLGSGCCSVFRNNSEVFALYKLTPIGGLLAGLYYSINGFKLLHRKAVFLLPLQYVFKRTAWNLGFIKAQINAYKRGIV